jgi:hypothetical protein
MPPQSPDCGRDAILTCLSIQEASSMPDLENSKMKIVTIAFLAASSLMACGAVFAQTADDKKWINKCVLDNKEAKVAASVVLAYCSCMNNKMSNNETLSITAWEKTHPVERAACDKESGWK